MNIGYGAGAIADYPWHLNGHRPWSLEDDEKAEACLKSLSSLGINYIDTAHRYGNGRSEDLIGQSVKGEEIKIFTKIELGTTQEMKSKLDLSKQRLGKINGLLLHNPDFSQTRLLHAASLWLTTLGFEYYGFSTEPAEDAKLYYDIYGLNAIEFPYSKWDRRAEDSIFPWAKKHFKIINRIRGGPLLGGVPERGVIEGLRFILENSNRIDLALIGTTNPEHLREVVEILKREFE